MQPISLQEVELEVNQMPDDTALGLGDFTIYFFHIFWNLLNHEVHEVVEESRQKQWILSALDATHLTLVPRETGASLPGNFKTIPLCNVI